MPDPEPADATDDRRSQLTAAAIVALVVLVLGFGSGIGAVFERDRAAGGSAAARDDSTGGAAGEVAVAATAGPTGPGATSGSTSASGSGSAGSRGGGGGSAAAPTTTTTSRARSAAPTTSPPTTRPTTTPTPTTAPPPAGPAGAAACPDLVSAMASPFLAHLRAAHLATSPGDQVADAADTDDYLLAHTALIESVLSPLVGLLLGAPDAVGPLWTHLQAAHLETSPGDQVADALGVDDYVLAHTVLVETMAGGPVGTALGTGTC